MIKRTLVFSSPSVLSLKNAQLVISLKEMPDEKRTVPIEDIGVVLIEHPMVSVTIPLLNALSDNNVAVVICDQRGMPNAMLQNLETNSCQGEVLRSQLAVGEVMRKQLWKQIVESKIRNQSRLLSKLGYHGDVLKPYYSHVKSGDSDNREGIAARIYWTELFGPGFVRDRNLPGINVLLNYGYSVLRAAVARALMSSGLLPAIGLFHHNRSNAFPLADDMMEPYRPFVDEVVFDLALQGCGELNQNTKGALLQVLCCDTYFQKTMRPLSIGLSMTMASLVKCYAKELSELSLPVLK